MLVGAQLFIGMSFDLINCYVFFPIYQFDAIRLQSPCLGHIPELSTPFLPIFLTKDIENTSILSQSFTLR